MERKDIIDIIKTKEKEELKLSDIMFDIDDYINLEHINIEYIKQQNQTKEKD